jgi:hypothetical protein
MRRKLRRRHRSTTSTLSNNVDQRSPASALSVAHRRGQSLDEQQIVAPPPSELAAIRPMPETRWQCFNFCGRTPAAGDRLGRGSSVPQHGGSTPPNASGAMAMPQDRWHRTGGPGSMAETLRWLRHAGNSSDSLAADNGPEILSLAHLVRDRTLPYQARPLMSCLNRPEPRPGRCLRWLRWRET